MDETVLSKSSLPGGTERFAFVHELVSADPERVLWAVLISTVFLWFWKNVLSMPSHVDNQDKWQNCCLHRTHHIRERVVSLRNSMSYSTDYGMVEYSPTTDTMGNVVRYPQNMQLSHHSVCADPNRGIMYLVDGINGYIISFDPIRHFFRVQASVPKIGGSSSCIVVEDNVHIFNGANNVGRHLIYDLNQNTLRMVNDSVTADGALGGVSIMEYKGTFIRFGGWCAENRESLDEVMVSDDSVEWTESIQWTLPQPLIGSGSVQYEHYIFLFGGGGLSGDSDEIYVLDLQREDKGWVMIEGLRCPQSCRYSACLYMDAESEDDHEVHLFTRGTPLGHYCIALHELIDAVDIERMTRFGM